MNACQIHKVSWDAPIQCPNCQDEITRLREELAQVGKDWALTKLERNSAVDKLDAERFSYQNAFEQWHIHADKAAKLREALVALKDDIHNEHCADEDDHCTWCDNITAALKEG